MTRGQNSETNTLTWRRRLLRLVRRIAAVCVGLFLLYFAIVLVGLIPVNNDFRPTADGVEIHIISTDVHADFILPMTTDTIDWRREFPADMFRGDTSRATHVMVGWGDKGFYLETRTWADFRIATALKALLWPTNSCLHVNLTRIDRLRIKPRTVTISIEQYESLVDFIEQTFARNDEGQRIPIVGSSYGRTDAFFEARGRYNCVNTCNAWIGRGMKRAGLRTPCFAPLPGSILLYLDDD